MMPTMGIYRRQQKMENISLRAGGQVRLAEQKLIQQENTISQETAYSMLIGGQKHFQ